MKNVGSKLGFTLIELLVVITIIGILATWAVTMYSSQIQKARDSGRITDLKSLQGAIEQVYQDVSVYPSADKILEKGNAESINWYITNVPRDSKTGTQCADGWAGWATESGWVCGYAYIRWDDQNNIANSGYEVSTAFESASNITKSSADAKDFWSDGDRFELWNNKTLDTTALGAGTTFSNTWACTAADALASATANEMIVFLWGNPSDLVASCQS